MTRRLNGLVIASTDLLGKVAVERGVGTGGYVRQQLGAVAPTPLVDRVKQAPQERFVHLVVGVDRRGGRFVDVPSAPSTARSTALRRERR
jgi:hypothetical protein